MENISLNYSASKIALAERDNNANFFDALASLGDKPSISALLFLFNAGGGTNEQFDELFKQGIEKIMSVIIDGLGNGGFLPKEDVKAAKDALTNLNNDQKASQSSGEKTKK